MRAPANKRSDDEIVADILKFANCLAGEKLVRRLIEYLRADLPPITGNRKQNAAFVRELRKQIDKLEQILETAPNEFALPAVFGDRFWSLWVQQDLMFIINPQTRSYIEQDGERLKRFLGELHHIRSRCNDIIKLKLGAHAHLKNQHVHAAYAAKALFEVAAAESRTKPRLTSSPTSKFCRVASLFLEAATGEYDLDLQRACEAVLRTKIPN
jgi:hypothetical protein